MDELLRNKLSQLEVIPPPQLWNEISEKLDVGDSAPAPVFSLKRMAIAAAVTGIIILGVLFLPRSGRQPVKTVAATQPASGTNIPVVPRSAPDAIAAGDLFPRTGSRVIQPVTQTSKAEKAGRIRLKRDEQFSSSAMMEPVSTNDLVEIKVPPLLDRSGQIIMNRALISDPTMSYISVTAPNGTQTRISNKFLDCITYLNSHFSADDSEKAAYCLDRFKDWRDKLLREAAFVPSANNFFDIFELQEMIQER